MQDSKAVKNASWLIVTRIIQALLSFIISSLTARLLGPSNFGLINYAASVVAFVVPVMKLGFDGILVQEYVDHPDDEGKILGTSLLLNIFSSVLCMIGVISFCMISTPNETETIIVCGLYSLMLIAQAIEMIQYWYQAHLLSKYTAIFSLVAYIIVSCYKAILLITECGIYWFAISNAIDYLVIGCALFTKYYKMGNQKLSISGETAKHLLSKGKYFILSGLMVTVFSQTSRIILKHYVDDTAVGYYSAAVAIAGVTNFVFSAVIDSMRPLIFEAKKCGSKIYEHRIKQLYSLIIYGALAQSILISVFAEIFVSIIYGEQYIASAPVLRVIVWYTAFSYFGGAKDIWILSEGKQRFLIPLNAAGAVINVILSVVLIKSIGVIGAAIATLATQFFTNILMCCFIPHLRHNIVLLLQALNPIYLKEMYFTGLKLIKKC